MSFLALNLLDSGVQLSMLCAVIGLIFAFVLIAIVARSPAGNERMRQISGAVLEGAKAYLNRQVVTISVIAVIIFILLFIFKDHPTAIGFVVGAFCSLSAGFIGMRIAVIANVRTTQAATSSSTRAMRMAFNGGAVTGLLVVGLALLSVSIFYTVADKMVGHDMAIRSLVGLALGASLISVFARLGGGIYTKAADVGADLVGKIEQGFEEDDPRRNSHAHATLFRLSHRPGYDSGRGRDHKLLHLDALRPCPKNRARVGDGSCYQHHRRVGGWPTRDGVAGWIHRHRYPP